MVDSLNKIIEYILTAPCLIKFILHTVYFHYFQKELQSACVATYITRLLNIPVKTTKNHLSSSAILSAVIIISPVVVIASIVSWSVTAIRSPSGPVCPVSSRFYVATIEDRWREFDPAKEH